MVDFNYLGIIFDMFLKKQKLKYYITILIFIFSKSFVFGQLDKNKDNKEKGEIKGLAT